MPRRLAKDGAPAILHSAPDVFVTYITSGAPPRNNRNRGVHVRDASLSLAAHADCDCRGDLDRNGAGAPDNLRSGRL